MLKDSAHGPSKHNLLEEEDAPELGAMSSLREDSESNLVTADLSIYLYRNNDLSKGDLWLASYNQA